jgi:SAM-dependent methyltransferase
LDRPLAPLGLVLTDTASKKRRPPPRVDLELEAGARAHFDDPVYYAETYCSLEADIAYYRAEASKVERVLEHGIGNGRIALPVARDGVAVTGIDHSRAMLTHFRAQLRREPKAVRQRVTLHKGDIRTVRLGIRFPRVFCPFNSALHLYTRADVEAWLARVHEHLEPRGELVFDISMPVPSDLARDPAHAYRVKPFEHPTAGRVRYREHFDYDRVRQILFVSMVFEPSPKRTAGSSKRHASPIGPFMTPLAQRMFQPQEMEALLHYNGFEVRALYGDFTRGPLTQSSDVMVWHASPRKNRARR